MTVSVMRNCTLAFLIIAALSLPCNAEDFQADAKVTAGEKVVESRFYYGGDCWRMEEQFPEGDRVTIFRTDTKSLYILWPDKQRYMVQPLPEDQFEIIASRKPGKEIERTELGKENVAGYPIVKYRVRYDSKGKPLETIEWYSKKLGVVLRSEIVGKDWKTEFSNIQEGKLDRKIFEVPDIYEPLSAQDVFRSPGNKRGQ